MKAILLIVVGCIAIIFAYKFPFNEAQKPFLLNIQGYIAGVALLLIGIAMLFGAC